MHSQLTAGSDARAGSKQAAIAGLWLWLGEQPQRASGRGLRASLAVLLCVVSLFAASVVQAAHVHDAPISLAAGKHLLLAPADECPLCAATHVAMASSVETTMQLLPRVERVPLGNGRVRPAARRWSFELFSRPPPMSARTRT